MTIFTLKVNKTWRYLILILKNKKKKIGEIRKSCKCYGF